MNKVDIVNLALAHLGQSPISDFDASNDSARKAKLLFDIARRKTMRAHPWNFATAQEKGILISLGSDENGEEKEFSPNMPFAYAYPNCLKVIKVFYPHCEHLYREEYKVFYLPEQKRKIIAAKDKDLWIEYIADITDCAIFDDMFVYAFSLCLAADLAAALGLDTKKAQLIYQKYLNEISDAQLENSREKLYRFAKISPSLLSRG